MDEEKLQQFLDFLGADSQLNNLATSIDNTKEPVHRWFPFMAGFSHNLVKKTVDYFKFSEEKTLLFDPFMGSGTSGVVGKECNIPVVGNESNPLLHEICTIKTNLPREVNNLQTMSRLLLEKVKTSWKRTSVEEENELLGRCYSNSILKKLVCLRNEILDTESLPEDERKFLFMALTMSLPKSANVRFAPYVSWRHRRIAGDPFALFKMNMSQITQDITETNRNHQLDSYVRVDLQDTRQCNPHIKNKSVGMVFTSPPYLNNFDYGEALKVYLYFWRVANGWGEITEKIRKHAVVSATTYYHGEPKVIDDPASILGARFSRNAPNTAQTILDKVQQITQEKLKRKSRKSFDLLTLHYFKDMRLSLREIYRVMKHDSSAFLVIGDSAPYGVHVPTDTLLGELALELGFSSYTLKPLRIRGTKWKTLRYRHNKKLRESLLVLRRS